MAIWFDRFPLDYARERAAQSMIGHLGIEVIEAGDDYLKARMPVDHRTKQPAGVLHGGASVALAGTLASWGAAFCVTAASTIASVSRSTRTTFARYPGARSLASPGRSIWAAPPRSGRSASPTSATSSSASRVSPWRC
jgi:hypothetical protein